MKRKTWMEESHNFVDIIHGVIPYNGLESLIIDTNVFSRLQRVLQSPLVYMTYPSNKVHRYEHSLGVMHLSGLLFYHAIANSDESTLNRFFSDIKEALDQEITAQTNNLPHSIFKFPKQALTDIRTGNYSVRAERIFVRKKRDEEDEDNENTELVEEKPKPFSVDLNEVYRDNTPSNLNQQDRFLYYVVFEAIRLVGLLHDLGHLPYSHVLENALKRLVEFAADANNDLKKPKQKERRDQFLSIVTPYFEKKKAKGKGPAIHEKLSQKLSDMIFLNIKEKKIDKMDNNSAGMFVTSVFFFASRILAAKEAYPDIFFDLHRIVDGVIDTDRMDFTCRDLFCAGISREFPRYERMFNTVQIYYQNELPNRGAEGDLDKETKIVLEKEHKPIRFAYNSKAVGQIEMLLERRWEDYANVNYHHAVHKRELLLEYVITELGKEYFLNGDGNHKQNDEMTFSVSAIWDALEQVSKNTAVDIFFSQLDDEWLNMLIKRYYFKHFGESYGEQQEHYDDVLFKRFDELVAARRHYYPLFKRRGGFRRLDDEFKEMIVKHKKYKRLFDEVEKDKEKKKESYESAREKSAISIVLDSVMRATGTKGNLTNEEWFFKEMSEKVHMWCEEKGAEFGIRDCLIDLNSGVDAGISPAERESICLVSSHQGMPTESFVGQSPIAQELQRRKDKYPEFHIFFLPVESKKDEADSLRKGLQTAIVEMFVDFIVSIDTSESEQENKECENQIKIDGIDPRFINSKVRFRVK